MFSKSKVSQSMIDAVNSVLGEKSEEKIVNNVLLDEASEKVPTPTGMKVYGSNYGNSMKARKDQTSHEIDKVKEPKDKELAKEELKGDQHKIDANHNDKIDAQDFKILKGKKKVKEELTFAEKLINSIQEKKDVVMPEDAPATSTPKKNQDVADKSYLKDKPGVKSDLKNLGRFLTGKKETNEAAKWRSHPSAYDDEGLLDGQKVSKGDKPDPLAIRQHIAKNNPSTRGASPKYLHKSTMDMAKKKSKLPEEVLHEDDNLGDIAKKHGMEFKRTTYGAGMKHPTHGEVSINRYGEWNHKGKTGDSTDKFASLDKHLSSLKEEVESLDEISIETMKSAKQKLANRSVDAHMDDNKRAARDYAGRALSMSSKIKKKERLKFEEAKLDEAKKMDDATRNLLIHAHAYATGKIAKKMMNGGYKDKGEMAIHHAQELNHALSTLSRGEKLKEDVTEEGLDEMINEVLSKDASAGDWIHDFVHSDNPKFAGKSKAERKKMALGAYYGKQNEATNDDAPITTDTLAGRLPGGKINSFKSYKLKVSPLDKEGDKTPPTPAIKQPVQTPARKSHEVHEDVEAVEEKVIAGTPGWEKQKKDVTDKSGAVHTPMSRAKDLARQSFKKLKNEMLGKAPGNN